MNCRPVVTAGQIYEDQDTRFPERRVTVLSVDIQTKKQGRLKARYTYADCMTSGRRRVKIDVDNLRSSRWLLVSDPCPVVEEGMIPAWLA